jgi:3-mercaptopyruvate sulfurtransferase SseA
MASAEWLMEHVDDVNFFITGCQPDIDESVQDHIAGALHADENLFRCHKRKIPAQWGPDEISKDTLPHD